MEERKIIISLIVSTEFCQRLAGKWTPTLFQSSTAKRLAAWVDEYFKKYSKAPGKDIEPIFFSKVKNGLSKELAEEIEEDILPGLSDQYEQEGVNIDYMVDLAIKYFNECHLQRFADEIKGLVETGQLIEAQNLASSFSPISTESNNWLELSDPSIITTIEQAFTKTTESLITYPRALGEFWNDQLTRGSFVAFLAPEKRGKSFWMLDMAMRGCRQGQRIAFFQAGDMTEDEQLIRIASYLSKQPMQSTANNKILIPVRDCYKNQTDCCDDDNREETIQLFNAKASNINNRETITFDELLEQLKIPGYSTCTNCKAFKENRWS